MKSCTRCDAEKPTTEFSNDSRSKGGLRSYCKPCGVRYSMEWQAKNLERHNAYRRAKPAPSNQGDARYAYHLEKTYGLTLEQYYAMLEAQAHVCATCGGTDEGRRLAVDHCHVTSRVRQLLCGGCNRGLGFFHDDPTLLERAIEYLGRSVAAVADRSAPSHQDSPPQPKPTPPTTPSARTPPSSPPARATPTTWRRSPARTASETTGPMNRVRTALSISSRPRSEPGQPGSCRRPVP